ncbi:MAG: ATPase domain-containing protein [Gemmatimonadota bacterium]
MNAIMVTQGPHGALREGSRARVLTGIEPLDKRWGGLMAPGVHVVAGAPGSGKLLCVLQFLNAGISAGRSVAFLSALSPEKVFREARGWGLELEDAWKHGQLRLLTFRADFQRRVLSAAVPEEMYEEFSELLAGGVERIGIDPGAALWETHAGSEPGARFMEWAEGTGSIVLATLPGGLEEALPAATEWVVQTAAGILLLERLPSGRYQLWPRRLSPPPESAGPITLEAAVGRGFVEPTGTLDRRRTDAPTEAASRLYLLDLTEELPAEVQGWAGGRFQLTVGREPLELVELLQRGEAYGQILVYLDRSRVEDAVQACRVIRSMSPAPVFLASDDTLRSTDRVRVLEAGATDVLSGHPSIAELEARIRRAAASSRGDGARGREARRVALDSDASSDGKASPGPDLLAKEPFAGAVTKRLAARGIFALVRLTAGESVRRALQDALLAQIRREAGDLVGSFGSGYCVLLEGIRRDQAQAFLGRVLDGLPAGSGEASGVAAEVLSSMTDAERIRAILGDSQPTTGRAGSAA